MVKIKISNKVNEETEQEVYLLLNAGIQRSFMTSNLAKKLGAPTVSSDRLNCYYSGDIEGRDSQAKVFSTNRYQGRECNFSIIITTPIRPQTQNLGNIRFTTVYGSII